MVNPSIKRKRTSVPNSPAVKTPRASIDGKRSGTSSKGGGKNAKAFDETKGDVVLTGSEASFTTAPSVALNSGTNALPTYHNHSHDMQAHVHSFESFHNPGAQETRDRGNSVDLFDIDDMEEEEEVHHEMGLSSYGGTSSHAAGMGAMMQGSDMSNSDGGWGWGSVVSEKQETLERENERKAELELLQHERHRMELERQKALEIATMTHYNQQQNGSMELLQKQREQERLEREQEALSMNVDHEEHSSVAGKEFTF